MQKEELILYIKNLEINIEEIENLDYKLELIIEKYYGERKIFQSLDNAYNKLAQLVIQDEYPNSRDWNRIAYEEGYLSSITIQCRLNRNWKDIRKFILEEIKDILKE